jgi:hypothetical protein
MNIHAALKVNVNNHGHIFIIDQMFDSVYFLYRTKKGARKCHLFRFGANFRPQGVDSSETHIVIYEKQTFKLYQIDHMISETKAVQWVKGPHGNLIAEQISTPLEIDSS